MICWIVALPGGFKFTENLFLSISLIENDIDYLIENVITMAKISQIILWSWIQWN
jgi:hypothetical protein